MSLPEPGDLFLGRADQVACFVLVELRLSGAPFQSLVRNPLVSPDIIGITHGASAAGVVGVVCLGISGPALTAFVGTGGLGAAAVIHLLAWRGGVVGYRFPLTGIGVAALATSVVSWGLTQNDVRDTQVALTWITGSLARADWPTPNPLLGCAGMLVPALAVSGGRLRSLELGDDPAAALGVPVERSRLWLSSVSVALAASAVAVTGPVAFVALVSAPIARRTVGAGRLGLVPATLVGAVTMLASELIAQFTIPETTLPVDVVTGVVGAPYPLWLLMRTNRSGAGG
ncbi:FecCD family ABC transporter permease [Nocardiopsis sp. NPDC050513]|uniref:FecCD family ABC transporter permease n=1 Tax=Nocardiopsis sp. NPDC050513 TaxID=3364338 RepID=UPI00379682CB